MAACLVVVQMLPLRRVAVGATLLQLESQGRRAFRFLRLARSEQESCVVALKCLQYYSISCHHQSALYFSSLPQLLLNFYSLQLLLGSRRHWPS